MGFQFGLVGPVDFGYGVQFPSYCFHKKITSITDNTRIVSAFQLQKMTIRSNTANTERLNRNRARTMPRNARPCSVHTEYLEVTTLTVVNDATVKTRVKYISVRKVQTVPSTFNRIANRAPPLYQSVDQVSSQPLRIVVTLLLQ